MSFRIRNTCPHVVDYRMIFLAVDMFFVTNPGNLQGDAEGLAAESLPTSISAEDVGQPNKFACFRFTNSESMRARGAASRKQ
ncbi:hypothetical protein [Paraburkholderia sp. ZP32-5]|uniref:hypothetical protein n=1 Tax=Paraburkholderia sp. ZP32-5 TaxID=2883245 RepID=UPI001F2D9097|nr:hypothetical protein [Paraburkholderia sp. ZP32-5]